MGPGSFEFHGLKDEEASSLLMTSAGQVRPWDKKTATWATVISKALGYLALAISVAGAAIRNEFCQFHDYLDYHEEQRQQRPARRRSRSASRESEDPRYVATSQLRDLGRILILNYRSPAGSVEATFDISYRAIASTDSEAGRDALQLLKTFGFLHSEDIRFCFLEKAVTNAAVEAEQQAKDNGKEDAVQAQRGPQAWSTWSNDLLFTVLERFSRNRGPPVLPEVLRSGESADDATTLKRLLYWWRYWLGRERKAISFDKIRVRAAMRQLTQYSLVVHNKERDSWSMHPLVHKWARETPDMTEGEQGVWSEAAALLLSSCILLPPLGTSIEDEEMRKDLLPHIDHVRHLRKSIEERIKDKRMGRMMPLPVFESGFNRERALMLGKFSIVYSQNGRWKDARRLQEPVRDFTMKVRGLRHSITRRITLALADTLQQLSQNDDAAALHEQVHNACMKFFGPEDHDTLCAKQSLGESRFAQGRFSDARKLLEEAMTGLQKLHGVDHEDTLNAMDHLGQTTALFYKEEDCRRARKLHQTAIDGMCRVHGADHLRTLIAKENLSRTASISGRHDDLVEAHKTMTEVLETRKTKLGKEHGYTLLAMANLATIKRDLRDSTGAEQLMLAALPIAERNVGVDHSAYLWGRIRLGSIWVQQQRWEEAESLLVDVTERQKYILQGRGEYHPDRVEGLIELANVHNALGKHDDCERVADEALDIMKKISKTEHPFATKLKADREVWRTNREASTTSAEESLATQRFSNDAVSGDARHRHVFSLQKSATNQF